MKSSGKQWAIVRYQAGNSPQRRRRVGADTLERLLLLGIAMGDANAVKETGRLANGKGLNNTAFAASWQTGDARSAVDLLFDTARVGQAAQFARTYAPSPVGKAVNAWRGELEQKGREKARLGLLLPTHSEAATVSYLRKAGRPHSTVRRTLSAGRRTGCILTPGRLVVHILDHFKGPR
jgi:hypothetical protein